MKRPINIKTQLISTLTLLSLSLLSAQTVKRDTIRENYYAPPTTITANRYVQKTFNARIPVQLIEKQDIQMHGHTTLGEAMSAQPGLDRISTGPWSEKPLIRGLSSSQILTLIDGLRLNVLRGYGQHAPLVDVDQVQRIEIIRGPASVQFGSDAIGGVINIISTKPQTSPGSWSWNPQLHLGFSSVNNQFSQTASISGSSTHNGFLLRYQHRKAEDMQTPQGRLNNTSFNGNSLDMKYLYAPDKHHKFLFNGQIQRFKDVGVPINPFATSAKFKHYNRSLAVASYTYSDPYSKLVNAQIKMYIQKGLRNFEADLAAIPKGPNFVYNKLSAQRDALTSGFQTQIRVMWNESHLMVMGLDGFQENDESSRTADAEIHNSNGQIIKNPPADYSPPGPKAMRIGIGGFIEDELTLKKWTITSGLRYDITKSKADATAGTLVAQNISENDADYCGNIGLLYKINDNFRLLMHLGRAFSAPTLQQRFFKGTAQVGYLEGNPDLQSETSLNLDTGFRWRLSTVQGEVALFRNNVRNYIVMAPQTAAADTFKYDNIGDALLTGGEITMQWHPISQFELKCSASSVKGEDRNGSTPLYQTPPIRLKLNITLQDERKRLWLKGYAVYTDRQDRVAENELISNAYTLFHLNFGIHLHHFMDLGIKSTLAVNIHNVLNTSYRDHLAAVQWWDAMGRNINLGLQLNM
ncbi:TonB-dependent receptor [bacterium]|nr:TonB-dependent receptor [bacterium]